MPDLSPPDPSRHPPARAEGYKSTLRRSPDQPLLRMPDTAGLAHGPVFGPRDLGPQDHDLLSNYAAGGSPIGERTLLSGRVLDEAGRPVPDTLVEIWQANAGGRYRHHRDGYLAPLDPHFGGCGRCLTDAEGRYTFLTVKPGAYPWPNWEASWRPAHVHFSVFGPSFSQRLITQMYFDGDPLVARCPIVNTIPSIAARDALVARLDMAEARPFDALAYRFDIVLRGPAATPFEDEGGT